MKQFDGESRYPHTNSVQTQGNVSKLTDKSSATRHEVPHDKSALPNAGEACAATQTGTEADRANVAVLMCTKDGARFLEQQLDSIQAQRGVALQLHVSDDGSTDNTLKILAEYQKGWDNGYFSVCQGPKAGYAANFLSLVCNPAIQADYYAFADQDDIWETDKLAVAIEKLAGIPPETPALYCSRTRLIDEKGLETGFTPLYRRAPSFANSLVQSLSGGNTMVFNAAARSLLCAAGKPQIVSHDWWVYSLVTGAGGTVIYDPEPRIRYRQHDQNVLGASPGPKAVWLRINLIMQGRFKNWNTINTAALSQARELLTPDNQRILDNYSAARQCWLIPRVLGVWQSHVYRQTHIGNLGLAVAVLLNRI